MDVRLRTLMAHWQQQVDPAFLAKVAVFAPEGIHLTGREKNHFVTMFQGECTHCHKLQAATGTWTLASAGE